MKQLILASASPRRAELLRQIGLDFQVVASRISEDLPDGAVTPEKLVMDLATAKVKQVALERTNGVVIGADTIVFLENAVLGKPGSAAEAVAMLTRLSGKTHQVFTGICVFEVETDRLITDFAMTEVVFRPFGPEEIQAYVRTGEPFDKAGAYGIQGRGALLVEKINGCYFNVVGLPIGKLVAALNELGFSFWQEKNG
jgi:septum formation protein